MLGDAAEQWIAVVALSILLGSTIWSFVKFGDD